MPGHFLIYFWYIDKDFSSLERSGENSKASNGSDDTRNLLDDGTSILFFGVVMVVVMIVVTVVVVVMVAFGGGVRASRLTLGNGEVVRQGQVGALHTAFSFSFQFDSRMKRSSPGRGHRLQS